jgi:predicted amino acid dehydrogenase
MNPADPALILDIAIGGPPGDDEAKVELFGKSFRVLWKAARDVKGAQRLVRRWTGEAAAIAVSGAAVRPGATVDRLRDAAGGCSVTDGSALDDVLREWAIRHVHSEMPGYFANARVVILGPGHRRSTHALREFTDNIEYADPLRRMHIPEVLDAYPVLGLAAAAGRAPLRIVPNEVRSAIGTPVAGVNDALGHALARKSVRDADVVVATYDELAGFGLEDLAGKTLVTTTVTDEQLAELAGRGVDLVLGATPQPFDVAVDAAVLEALMMATGSGSLTNDDLLDMIVSAGLEPRVLRPNGPRRKSRFAFVIHPLSQKHLTRVEPLGTLSKVAPPLVMDAVEKAMAYLPPFTYSHVTGITSPTGAEAEGWLITVGGTPKELMAHSPEFTYGRLLAAAEIARKLGAQVMGLGAFTKVVGDAGVTVAKRAPLPVTTGNSYSASAALWAAHEAVDRLGLLERDQDGRIHGRAMVVGATGAIGSVCARLLALASDELWLVSPESAKLLALKHEIEASDPRAVVHVAATPDEYLSEMDLVVTATSGAGKRVLDIMAVKPGCVITDVARPLDLTAEDVAKRPDVLVIESGEIEVPGDVVMKDIGLPDGVVYACLAETVVLALEGRYEPFTVGRSIEWEKVKEIYQLGLKHGMRLAAISGVDGVFTDEDFDRVRALARTSIART